MAQKKKSQSKVKSAKAAPRAVAKAPAKATKPAAAKKTAKIVKATASKASSKSAKPAVKSASAKSAAAASAKSAASAKAASKTKAAVKPAAKPVVKAPAAPTVHAASAAGKSAAAVLTKKPAAPVAAPAKPVAQTAAKPAAPAKSSTKPVFTATAVAKPQQARAVAASAAMPAKISAPVASSLPKPGVPGKPVAPVAAKPAEKKPVGQRHGFKMNEHIVYPAHGVGRIVNIEEQEIAGMSLELFVITFEKEKLTLRVPTGKLESVGMRKLAEEDTVRKAMETLKGRARVKRTMWSRRAQEYVQKINSGDLVAIAEVVRDLYRSEAQPEQSYSERQLYEDALDRMARELAAVEKLDERGAVQRITDVLSKSARGRRVIAEGAAENEPDTETEAEAA